MKYVRYTQTVVNRPVVDGVCHRSKVEHLFVPGASVIATTISDEEHARIVEEWGGVEVKPAVNAPAEGDAFGKKKTAKN